MSNTTTKKQVKAALAKGETLEDLTCWYIPGDPRDYGYGEPTPPWVRCRGTDLPEREFDDGYGGVEGESVICWSPKYVYVKACYDGAEWVDAVPRNPFEVTHIPVIGGG